LNVARRQYAGNKKNAGHSLTGHILMDLFELALLLKCDPDFITVEIRIKKCAFVSYFVSVMLS